MSENLSEKLFKPQFNYPETSTLIQRIGNGNEDFHSMFDGDAMSNWYRVLNLLSWHWRGLSLIEVNEVLARISASTKKRTNDKWLDTVVGFEPGNWIYEFLSQSAIWQKKAEILNKAEQTDDNQRLCQEAWLVASLFAGVASYPHYRNDELANHAYTLAVRAYHESMNYSPYFFKSLDFNVEGKTVKALLHLPIGKKEVTSCPIVFVCSGLANLQIDFYQYFATFLAPMGIGMLTVDIPSIGSSRQFNLTQNSSFIHQQILEQLHTVQGVDYGNVILFGFRFGANIATRLAYFMPQKIKGLINVGPMVHQFFVDQSLQAKLPRMFKDMIASRLSLERISDQQITAEIKFFSLKEQRLLSRPCNVPVLNMVLDGDLLSSESEAKLITSSKDAKLIKITEKSLKESYRAASKVSANWIQSLIK